MEKVLEKADLEEEILKKQKNNTYLNDKLHPLLKIILSANADSIF